MFLSHSPTHLYLKVSFSAKNIYICVCSFTVCSQLAAHACVHVCLHAKTHANKQRLLVHKLNSWFAQIQRERQNEAKTPGGTLGVPAGMKTPPGGFLCANTSSGCNAYWSKSTSVLSCVKFVRQPLTVKLKKALQGFYDHDHFKIASNRIENIVSYILFIFKLRTRLFLTRVNNHVIPCVCGI